MQFTLRQLLLFVAAVAVILALWQYLGPAATIVLAFAGGLFWFCVQHTASNWGSATGLQKLYGLVGSFASLGVVYFAVHQFVAFGAIEQQRCVRNSEELRRILHAEPRFEAVQVEYENYGSKWQCLIIKGAVESHDDLNELRRIVHQFDWTGLGDVSWSLTICDHETYDVSETPGPQSIGH